MGKASAILPYIPIALSVAVLALAWEAREGYRNTTTYVVSEGGYFRKLRDDVLSETGQIESAKIAILALKKDVEKAKRKALADLQEIERLKSKLLADQTSRANHLPSE
jgi:hypothetical protein